MPDLKRISKNAIPGALEKATHYRLLNQPWQAESICLDILNTEPDNQQAIYILILSLTDQFDSAGNNRSSEALEKVQNLRDNYQKEYCTGLIYERQATAAIKRKTPRAGYIAFEHIMRAIEHYQNAEKLRPEANDESVLRWNGCIRLILHHNLEPSPEETGTQPFLDAF